MLIDVQDEFPEWLCWRGPDGPSGKFYGLHRRWPAGSGYQVKADDPAGLRAVIAAPGSENLRVIMLGPPFGLPEGHPHLGPDPAAPG